MTTYKNTGETYYAGHAPGEEFTANLSPEAERRAVARGSIRVVKREEAKPKGGSKSDA